MVVFLDLHPQQVNDGISGGLVLHVADGWVLQELIATACHTAEDIKYTVSPVDCCSLFTMFST